MPVEAKFDEALTVLEQHGVDFIVVPFLRQLLAEIQRPGKG